MSVIFDRPLLLRVRLFQGLMLCQLFQFIDTFDIINNTKWVLGWRSRHFPQTPLLVMLRSSNEDDDDKIDRIEASKRIDRHVEKRTITLWMKRKRPEATARRLISICCPYSQFKSHCYRKSLYLWIKLPSQCYRHATLTPAPESSITRVNT